MARIGIYKAKRRLYTLLERVERGESFTITRHGRPVAELRPVREGAGLSINKAIAGLRAFRRGRSLGNTSIRELIQDGRRL